MADLFTKEQRNKIDNMEIEERVELIRSLFWNGQKFGEDYTEVIGSEDTGTTPENMEYFLKGATAMFDTAQMVAANHWHGHKHINDQCNLENNFLLSTMETAFEAINPSKMATWKKLQEEL